MSASESESIRVLLAEQNEYTRMLIRQILKRSFDETFSFFESTSIKETERYLNVIQPSIILINYMFADSSAGKRVIRLSSQGNADPCISIVIRSNDWNIDQCSRWLEEGFTGCITKPVSPERVIESIQRANPQIKLH